MHNFVPVTPSTVQPQSSTFPRTQTKKLLLQLFGVSLLSFASSSTLIALSQSPPSVAVLGVSLDHGRAVYHRIAKQSWG